MDYPFLHTNQQVAHPTLDMQLLQEKEQSIPNAIQYSIKRYQKPATWNFANSGQFVYHYNTDAKESFVELQFCLVMQEYCNDKKKNCDFCKDKASFTCAELIPTVDFISIQFSANHLQQFFSSKQNNNLLESIIQFKYSESFTTSITLNYKTVHVLQNILNHTYTGSFENIYFNAQTQMLLLYSFESLGGESTIGFSCKFLATETEREKIIKARDILLQQIGEPLTIKALSRKVAMNECYLKKGFKELFGQTIFDFYQSQRMEHAKYLLYSKGLTVTDVSELLGYSSISHFSTAFKKLTGIKPCELLLR
jgi:AraC family transcriptional regulator